MHARPGSFVIVIAALAFAACPEDDKRPLGSTCSGDEDCAEGQCLAGHCLDPQADDDLDTLANGLEAGLGTNPLDPDTDGDGVSDLDEIGDVGSPTDTDGDGRPDAIESRVGDVDKDCIVDQLDADDAAVETDAAALGAIVCQRVGACGAVGAVVTATCGGTDIRTATCDYTGVPGYEGDEARCDAIDNDCDGATDERFATGGSVTFDGGSYAADAGKALGAACGTGACAGGTVECAVDMASLVCSTSGNVGPLTCDGDMDCDGTPDLDEVGDPLTTPLVGCVDHFVDTDQDDFGAGAGTCLCEPAGDFVVTNDDDCEPELGAIHPGADPICGVDADCDQALLDVGEPCDDGNDVTIDGCASCTVVPRRLASVGELPGGTVGARLEGGGFALAWEDGWDPNTEAYLGKTLVVFDADGHEIARHEGVGDPTALSYGFRLAALRGGGLVLGIWDASDVGYNLSVQRYDAAGSEVGAPLDALPSDSPNTYGVALVPTSVGGFAAAWVERGDGESLVVVRHFDADGEPVGQGTDFTVAVDVYDLDALGFADGELVLAWRQYDESDGHYHLRARRVASGDTLVGDEFEIDGQALDPKIAFELTEAPTPGQWAAFFLEDRRGDGVQFNATGYVVFDGGDDVVTPATFVQASDTDGCPYYVVGGFDASGQAFAGLYDDECGSGVRAWLATGSGTVALPLHEDDGSTYTRSLVAIGGADPVFAYTVGASPESPDRGVYISRFDATGAPRYVPVDLSRD